MIRGSFITVFLGVAVLIASVHCGSRCKAPSTDADQPMSQKCVANSIWMEGNACTDSCNKEVMRCTSEMTLGCYCIDDYRKVNGACVTKEECP